MAIRNRLVLRPAQEAIMLDHCAHARFVWNLAVEQQSWWRPGRDSGPGFAEQCRQLTAARGEFEWLRNGSNHVQQQALRDFSKAMGAFFDRTNAAAKPSFRSRRRTQSFAIRETKVRRLNRRWGAVFVPKCGYVRFRWTRGLPATLGMSRVTCDGVGRWHVSFPAPQPAKQRERTGKTVGIDRGVRTALVTSDGQHYRAPRISDRQAARYLAAQQRMARQRKRSAKRENARRTIALIGAQVAGRRKDWAEKISNRVVGEADLIVLERLNVRGMTKRPAVKPDPELAGNFLPNRRAQKAGLNRGILASCWGMLATRLDQKAAASGVTVVQINPRFTSQQCHVCGHTAKESRESQAVFRCVSCGHEDHADRNAARNILARGLLLATGELVPAHAPGHGVSRPHQPAQAATGITQEAA